MPQPKNLTDKGKAIMKKKIMAAAALTAALQLISVTGNAAAIDFADESFAGGFSALNNGNIIKRGLCEKDGFSAYRCSGNGEIGFRILDAIDSGIINDIGSYYTVRAKALSDGAGGSVNVACGTPGGVNGAEKANSVTDGEWSDVSVSFAADGVLDNAALSFAANTDGGGELYIRDAEIEKRSVRIEKQQEAEKHDNFFNSKTDDFTIIGVRNKGWNYTGAANNPMLNNKDASQAEPGFGFDVQSKNFLNFTQEDYGKTVTFGMKSILYKLPSNAEVKMLVSAKDSDGNMVLEKEFAVPGVNAGGIGGVNVNDMRYSEFSFTVSPKTADIKTISCIFVDADAYIALVDDMRFTKSEVLDSETGEPIF